MQQYTVQYWNAAKVSWMETLEYGSKQSCVKLVIRLANAGYNAKIVAVENNNTKRQGEQR